MNEIKQKEFVVFDVETTGLSPVSGDRVIEIAAVKVRGLQVVEEFYSLINPQREISFGAFAVNGISRAMVDGAPTARKIIPAFLEFIKTSVLIGHNVKFDLGFLSYELSLLELKLSPQTVALDTIRMARALIPGLGSYSLASVSYALGITEIQRHRAMADVMMTWEVFERLRQNAERKNLTQWDAWLKLFSNPKYSSSRYERSSS
mgnify:CR=1 FL=1